ncbi:MAG: DUF423 domain-containing protein [Cytophagales bacterium]|mgnify:FL=1|jgi:uncharacterized membrane protein YgdD (TMEM256/DUF423 family)|tara:strand:+ start:71 stop:433 length:363 start_codon:yes stop_codon:yes gene_type:complete
MHKQVIVLGTLLCAMAVLIGAFGAHLLQPLLFENSRESTFNTAINYLIFHALGVLLSGITLKKSKLIALFFMSGIVIFSGSLIALSVTNITSLGALAPIGGSCFVIGWILFARSAYLNIK